MTKTTVIMNYITCYFNHCRINGHAFKNKSLSESQKTLYKS